MGKITYQDDQESGTLEVLTYQHGNGGPWPYIKIQFNNAEISLGPRMARRLMLLLEDQLRTGPRV